MKKVIATRGSALALWQANHIKALLEKQYPGITVELNVIKTTGDKILDVPLAQFGGKGVFVKEIEEALLSGEADIAVHSMKDVPVELPAELEIYANPLREKPNDAFLSIKYDSLSSLPENAVIGTSSLRRKAQLLKMMPSLTIKDLRGNVDTRIRKLHNGEFDAIILAEAGLRRLNITENIKQSIPADIMIPAVCQGVLGIEVRKDDADTKRTIDFLKDSGTETAVKAERAFLSRLEGGCQAPIGCYAKLDGAKINITGFISGLDGKKMIIHRMSGDTASPEALGTALANQALSDGGKEILDQLYGRK